MVRMVQRKDGERVREQERGVWRDILVQQDVDISAGLLLVREMTIEM